MISVLITCYNAQHFIVTAVRSALNQTLQPDEIIVVDDGSTDDSIKYLVANFSEEPKVKLVTQKNLGQMAALNTAYEHCRGDIIFFMDGDDLFAPSHVEDIASIFAEKSTIDFIFTGYKQIGSHTKTVLPLGTKDRDLGYSVISSIVAGASVGGMTSMNAMRRTIAAKVFPPPPAVCESGDAYGDRLLLIGASIMGARKYYRAQTNVNYRQHDENHSLKGVCQKYNFRFALNNQRTIEAYRLRSFIPSDIAIHALAEFKTVGLPTKKELSMYSKIILRSNLPLLKRLDRCFSAFKYFIRQKKYLSLDRDQSTQAQNPKLRDT